MNFDVSRDTKNRILITINAAMMAIVVAKLWRQGASVAWQMQVWLAMSPVVLGFAHREVGARFAKLAHAGLFLLTGAALGLTLGTAVSDPHAMSVVEWAWLLAAILGVLLHYAAGPDDPYLTR